VRSRARTRGGRRCRSFLWSYCVVGIDIVLSDPYGIARVVCQPVGVLDDDCGVAGALKHQIPVRRAFLTLRVGTVGRKPSTVLAARVHVNQIAPGEDVEDIFLNKLPTQQRDNQPGGGVGIVGCQDHLCHVTSYSIGLGIWGSRFTAHIPAPSPQVEVQLIVCVGPAPGISPIVSGSPPAEAMLAPGGGTNRQF